MLVEHTSPLSRLSLAERWECLQGEVLAWLIGDGVIDNEERRLLEVACELYLGTSVQTRLAVGDKEWVAMTRHASGTETNDQRYERLATNLARRLCESGHHVLTPQAFQQVVDWLVRRHFHPVASYHPYAHRPRFTASVPGQPRGFEAGVYIASKQGQATSIAESFESWTRIHAARVDAAYEALREVPVHPAVPVGSRSPDASQPPAAPFAPLTPAETADTTKSLPIEATSQVQDTAPTEPAREVPPSHDTSAAPPPVPALTHAEPTPAPLPQAALPPEPHAPSAEVVAVDAEAVRERLREQLENDPHAAVLQAVATDPERFFREHAAFAATASGPVWFLASAPGKVWFAGDVHGDLLAFESVCDVFERQSAAEDKLVFLGDLVDRGFHDRAVILALWARMQAAPGRYGWIVGNHDTGVSYDAGSGTFTASVAPAEFPIWLNEHLDDASARALGEAFIAMAAVAPRAVFLPGLLAAHGGFPHSDRWASLQTRQDLESSANLDDFVWNRLHASRVKLPNRTSRSSSFGSDDFHGFRNVMRDRLDWPLEAMVRGHDHVHETQARWYRPGEVKRGNFGERVLTVNTLSHNQPGEINPYAPQNPRQPTLARWQAGNLPTPIVVDIPTELVTAYADPCPTCQRPRKAAACGCTP